MWTVAALMVLGQGPALAPRLKQRTPILTYHDVIARRDKQSVWFDCTAAEFELQMKWLLAQGAEPISLDELYESLTTGRSRRKRPVVITFADNYAGFYRYALPVLRRLRIPAAMFVHTDYVGSPVGRPKMTWTQLKELSRGGLVTVASQTCSHPADLRKLPAPALEREMRRSKQVLETQLGLPIRYLAYPNGKFDARTQAAARSAGYAMAFTEECVPAERSPSLFAVARYVHTKYRQAWRDRQK